MVRDALTGKPIRHTQDAILVDNIVPMARKLGYLISNYRFILFGIIGILFAGLVFASYSSCNGYFYGVLGESIQLCEFDQNYSTLYNHTITLVNHTYLNFDGVNDVIEPQTTDLYYNLGDNYTFSFWYRFIDTDGVIDGDDRGSVLGGEGSLADFLYFIPAQDRFNLEFSTTADVYLIEFNSTINQTKWNHYLITFQSNETSINVSLYVNSIYHDTDYAKNDTFYIEYIGDGYGGAGGSARYLKGDLDEIRIYNKTLSKLEIDLIYNSQFTANTSLPNENLQLWYIFNQNAGSNVYDYSGNNYNGI